MSNPVDTLPNSGTLWTHPPRVAICAITYRRPEGLKRLLDGLSLLRFRGGPAPDVRIVVVDNDPQGTGIRLCEAAASDVSWPVVAIAEPRRGIPFARNAALEASVESSDFIAFIDDDEEPDPFWLDELLRVLHAHDADIATGSVVPRFVEGTPRWLIEGRFFDRPMPPSGSRMETARTGNVLIRTSVLKGMETWFDEGMALTGGTDTHFFLRAVAAGASIVSAPDAVVHEQVPLSRATSRWILQRAYRLGNTLSLCDRSLDGSPARLTLRAVKGGGRIVRGLVTTGMAPLAGPRVRIRALRGMKDVMFGAGMLSGLMGKRYEEYRHVHGG